MRSRTGPDATSAQSLEDLVAAGALDGAEDVDAELPSDEGAALLSGAAFLSAGTDSAEEPPSDPELELLLFDA